MWKWKSYVDFQYGGRLGEFNGMSSQSHVSHCRLLPLGEFTVTIPEPHATLQGAATWRNQCRDRATLQGVRIHPPYWKSLFAIFYFFLFLMQFRLWRAPAFASSPIPLFYWLPYCTGAVIEPGSSLTHDQLLLQAAIAIVFNFNVFVCPHDNVISFDALSVCNGQTDEGRRSVWFAT